MPIPRSPEAQAEYERLKALERERDERIERTVEERAAALKIKRRDQIARAREIREDRAEFRKIAREEKIWDENNKQLQNKPLKQLATSIDPQKHKERLDTLYESYMAVYERGLMSKDEKIALKCADVIRGMHIGAIGKGEPVQDMRNSELMVLGALPDVESGPTAGELEEPPEEEAAYFEDEEEDDDDDTPEVRLDEYGNPIEVIEEEYEERYE